jgi:hypothetical protein
MHLIAQNKYKFNISTKLQRHHLLDIWHLDKAHWFTLFGVSVGDVYCKTPELVRFDLHRFGQINPVVITQDDKATEVEVNNCRLRFIIEDAKDDCHYLHVALFSHHKALRLLWPAIQAIFFLTVLEDSIYYAEK